MGTPDSAVPVLRRLHSMPGVEPVAAVTPPDRPRGRGRQPEPPPVKDAATEVGVPVLQPPNLRGESVRSQLAELAPDVIVVAAYGRFLPPAILDLPLHGCLNIHPSLLPRHRGPSPVATAILDGDGITGVSLMLLDEGMDTGPVIAQREYPLTGQETAGELTGTLFDMGADLLADSIGPWVSGELTAQAQDDALATVTRKLERADGRADWTLPAETLARQCRAYDPWPGLYTEWQGRTLKLLEVALGERPHPDAPTLTLPRGEREFWRGEGTVTPGMVVAGGRHSGIFVATGIGMLTINRLQLEGRRPVSAHEFLTGYPDFTGSALGSY